jgi:hypothetical protein
MTFLEREFERIQTWFYAGAQGAITRFLVRPLLAFFFPSCSLNSFQLNSRATHDVAVCGYQALADASTDTALLLRFLSLATETHVHPLVLQIVADRVQGIIASMMA